MVLRKVGGGRGRSRRGRWWVRVRGRREERERGWMGQGECYFIFKGGTHILEIKLIKSQKVF